MISLNGMTNPFSNKSCDVVYTVNMIDPKELLFVVNTYIQAILAKIVPCVLLTVLTFLLIYAMHQAYQKRKLLKSQGKDQDARRHHEHNRTTGMLLAVVILFLLVELPFGILTLCSGTHLQNIEIKVSRNCLLILQYSKKLTALLHRARSS
jgi:fumarate reductase subunit D